MSNKTTVIRRRVKLRCPAKKRCGSPMQTFMSMSKHLMLFHSWDHARIDRWIESIDVDSLEERYA